MSTVILVHDCDIERRGDGSAPADVGGDFRDCHLQSENPTNIYDQYQIIAGKHDFGGKGGLAGRNSLLWFDLNRFLPAGATIINAVWHFYIHANSTTGSQSFDVDRITQIGWREGTVNGASWTYYVATSPWTNPGGDYSAPTITLGTITGTGWKSYNIFSLVSDAWTNRAGICTFGLRRIDADSNTGAIYVHAKNYRPFGSDKVHHLRVTYTLDGRTFEAIVT